MSQSTIHILDTDQDIQVLLKSFFKKKLYNTYYHDSYESLRQGLSDHKSDLVMLSRFATGSDSIDIIKKIKESDSSKEVPIILMTSTTNDKQVAEGMNLGINFYLPKPLSKQSVSGAIKTVLHQKHQLDLYQNKSSFLDSIPKLTNTYSANIKNHSDSKDIIQFLNLLFHGDKTTLNVITELTNNAIEHGIYKIGHERKNLLIESEKWEKEIGKKQELHKNDNLFINLRFKRKRNTLEIIIIDPGKGFKYEEYKMFDTSMASNHSGRGIAKSFSQNKCSIEYNKDGNEVKISKEL